MSPASPTASSGWGPKAYATSKLANVLFTKELARRLDGTTATANCFEPGSVRTRFGGFSGNDYGFVANFIYALDAPFSTTPEVGADSLIWLATSSAASSLNGAYVSKRKVTVPQKQARDAQPARDLWSLSERLCDAAIARA